MRLYNSVFHGGSLIWSYILEVLALSQELQSYYHYKIIVLFVAVGVTFIFRVCCDFKIY